MRTLLVVLLLAALAAPRPAAAEAADDFGPRQALLETPWFTSCSYFGFV